MPTPRALGKSVRPIYSRIKRISLYPQHAALKPFFTELETLPNDLANEALLRAVSLGAETALREAQQKLSQRRQGLGETETHLQPALLDLRLEQPCAS
jgi:hypothetical protein